MLQCQWELNQMSPDLTLKNQKLNNQEIKSTKSTIIS